MAHPGESVMRRSRPLTAHQLAVERNRNQRVDYILSRGLRKKHHQTRKARRQEGAFCRALKRTEKMLDPFDDSEGEESLIRNPMPFRERGFGGLVQLEIEEDDFGEEMSAYAAAFRRMGRRLDRWDGQQGLNLGVMGTNRVLQQKPVDVNGNPRDNDETEDERPAGEEQKQHANGEGGMEEDEDLDDMEKEILGLGSENDEDDDVEGEEDLDDMEKALLGIRGDETEEEVSDGGMDVD